MRIPDDQIRTSEVRGWKGIHLVHVWESACSQKVRILLRAKKIPWVSHPVDLARQQHVTPWFLGIDPRGLPGLVTRGDAACRRLRGTTLGDLLADAAR